MYLMGDSYLHVSGESACPWRCAGPMVFYHQRYEMRTSSLYLTVSMALLGTFSLVSNAFGDLTTKNTGPTPISINLSVPCDAPPQMVPLGSWSASNGHAAGSGNMQA